MNDKDLINIPETIKKFKDEWLLFEEIEEKDGEPYLGRLLHHTKDRDEINQKDLECKGKLTYVVYTGEVIPKGMEVCLLSKPPSIFPPAP